MVLASDILSDTLKSALRHYRAYTKRIEEWSPNESITRENLEAARDFLMLEIVSELDCALEEHGVEV